MPRVFRRLSLVALGLFGLGLGGCDDDSGAVVADAGAEPEDGAIPSDGSSPDGSGGTGSGPTRLRLRTVDSATGKLLPGMVSLFDGKTGKRLTFGITEVDYGTPSMGATLREVGGALATWHGFAVWRGEAVIPIGTPWDVMTGSKKIGTDIVPFGRYRVVANRGLEYELAEATVDLAANKGEITVTLPLARTVDTTGYFGADMHLHSAPGSADAIISMADRLKTLVVAGVDVAVSADHDFISDISDEARALWTPLGQAPPLGTINGDEAGYFDANAQVIGHFNIVPMKPDRTKPRNGVATDTPLGSTPDRFLQLLRKSGPMNAWVQLNHPRLGWGGYFDHLPTCGGWSDRSVLPRCSVDFDVLEVLNGYLVCGSKIEQTLQDWYALLGFGRMVTATGNSDSHGTSLILAGFPRTYVRVADDRVESFDESAFIEAVRAHHAVATTGPFLTMRVTGNAEEGALVTAPGGSLTVSLRMQAASWVLVDEVQLKVNGALVKTWPVTRTNGASPFFEVQNEPITVAADAFITAEARGTKPLSPDIVGEKQTLPPPDGCDPLPGGQPGVMPFAVTNPVWVDVDGDGRFR